jgi:asparagine synthase (glutamine-hydrolysing)
MCGITGAFSLNDLGKHFLAKVPTSVASMKFRGPDSNNTVAFENVALGHSRLAIIDTSNAASQPFTDLTGRYTIVFNGEFFNFEDHRNDLITKGYTFRSQSDTEVLLYLYITYGLECVEKINGFFAFAIYDKQNNELFLARDRSGEKPFLYYEDENVFLFASEMKALLAYGIEKEIDHQSLLSYLQLNYIPAPQSIFRKVKKLLPGHYAIFKNGELRISKYYSIQNKVDTSISYQDAQTQLHSLLDASVKRRLISDVPLGAFLSGGIDSSIVVALASKYVDGLQTFSIGYKDEPFFDETSYANLVAKKFGTKHTVYSLTNADLFENVNAVLDYIDEPFADSSALAVYMVSKCTRQNVTVALSGDGADEMFGGYNKHMAHYKAISRPIANLAIKASLPILEMFPKSRNNRYMNLARQMHRYGKGCQLNAKDRYWRWCSFTTEQEALKLLTVDAKNTEYEQRKAAILVDISNSNDLNQILMTDMNLVLANDMLTKVDLMSMANSLEVRSPFLDHTVFDYAFTLPTWFKVDGQMKKKILQDCFQNILPEELYNRPKKGFEVPLLKWLRGDMKPMIQEYLLDEAFIKEQGLFNYAELKILFNTLLSSNPGESHARIWGLLVFQYWYKKYIY